MDSYKSAYTALNNQANKIVSLTHCYVDIAAEAGIDTAQINQMKKTIDDIVVMINNIRKLDINSDEVAAFCWKQMLVAISYLVSIIRECDLAIVNAVKFEGRCSLCNSELIMVNDFSMCRFCGRG